MKARLRAMGDQRISADGVVEDVSVRKTELRQVILGVTAPTVDAQASLPQIGKDVLVIEDNKVNQFVPHFRNQPERVQMRLVGVDLFGI